MKFPTPEDVRKLYEEQNAPVIEAFMKECQAQLVRLGPKGGVYSPNTALPSDLRPLIQSELQKSGWGIDFHCDYYDTITVNIKPL